jgi:hypothetical protein
MHEAERQDRGAWLMIALAFLALLLLLAASAYVAWRVSRAKAEMESSAVLVSIISMAISTYPVKTWTWHETNPPDSRPQTDSLWDLNHDGLIDGTPGISASVISDGGFTADLITSGYGGFDALARPPIAPHFLNRRRQVIDSWGHPLRIGFASGIYGKSWFGIWSPGPDGIDSTADDLRSW